MFSNVICHILGLCSVFDTNTCEKHTNLVNVSTEWVLVMCWLLSVILKKYTESTVGLFYPEYLPTNDHKPQLILEITGELDWSGLTCGVLDCLDLQDGQAHSLLLLSPLPTPSPPTPQCCWQHVRVCLFMVQEESKLVFPNSGISEGNETADQGIIV